MDEQARPDGDDPSHPFNTSVRRRPRRRLWLLAVLLVVVGVASLIGWWLWNRPRDVPLQGELLVSLIRSDKGGLKGWGIEETGALPAKTSDRLHVVVRYNQPAHTYLLRVDGQGNILPLYPWNLDTMEVKDANESPPPSRATKIVFSPMTRGHGWEFDAQSGLETVILLARRTPVDDKTHLSTLLGALPPFKMRDRAELALFGLEPGTAAFAVKLASNRGTADEAREIDRPLLAVLERLRDRFEVIQVARFALAGK